MAQHYKDLQAGACHCGYRSSLHAHVHGKAEEPVPENIQDSSGYDRLHGQIRRSVIAQEGTQESRADKSRKEIDKQHSIIHDIRHGLIICSEKAEYLLMKDPYQGPHQEAYPGHQYHCSRKHGMGLFLPALAPGNTHGHCTAHTAEYSQKYHKSEDRIEGCNGSRTEGTYRLSYGYGIHEAIDGHYQGTSDGCSQIMSEKLFYVIS